MSPAQRRSPSRQADAAAPSADQVDAVLRTSHALVGIAADAVAAVNDTVTVPQLRVLMMVHTRGPLNLGAVATGLDVNPSNASRICDRLIKAGLLDRRDSPSDRRNITLSLTSAGRQLVSKVARHRRTAITRVLRRMDAADRELLATALDRFAAAGGERDCGDAAALIWPPGQ